MTPPTTPEDGAALARSYRKLLWRVMFWGNIVAALPLIVPIVVSQGVDPDPAHASQHVMITLVLDAVWIVIFGAGVAVTIRRLFRLVTRWLTEARPAGPDEQQALTVLPRRVGTWSAYWWAIDLVWITPLVLTLYRESRHAVELAMFQNVIGIAAGGTTAAILTYLLTERSLRPLVGLATRGSTSVELGRARAISRLLMAFTAGVVAPLTILATSLIGLNERQRAGAEPLIWATIAGVVIVGFVVAVVTAKTLTDPLDEIRARFERIKGGDLDVDLEVNEPGEIGELQAGFNDMVTGLRERERMREVFGRLVGKDVAEHALAHGSELDGQMCEASAMFVDVVGSTPLAQNSTEYGYWTALNSFFDVVVGVVEGAGGFVNKFEGDGALCIFGAPVTQEDHAARALSTARLLRTELDRFAQKSGIHTAIGLSTGNVVAGYVGTADRYEFTVVGDAVNEAKRLTVEAKTKEPKILVSESTIRAAEGEVAHWRESGSTQLRGRTEPTVAYAPGPGNI